MAFFILYTSFIIIPFFSDLTEGTAVSLIVGVILRKTLKATISAIDDAYLSWKEETWRTFFKTSV